MSKPLSSGQDLILSPDLASNRFSTATPDLSGVAQVPSTAFLLDGEFHRSGDALVIIGPDGGFFTLKHYFSTDSPPVLTTADGRFLLPETVELLLVADPSATQTVMVAGPNMLSTKVDPIGHVNQITGAATIKSKSGLVRTLGKDDKIFQGDVIKTKVGGLVKVVFQDQTSFQLGEKASLVLNKYIYNPDAGKGTFEATVLTGAFKFKSGGLGHLHRGQHARIKTPTAVIGIRGSELSGEVTADGQTTVVHTSGILEISDAQGMGTVTLLEPGMATIINFGESPQPTFKASQAILDRLNSQLPAVLPGNNPDADNGNELGNKSLTDAYNALEAALGDGNLDLKIAGLDLNNMSEKDVNWFGNGLTQLTALLPPPPVEPELFYGAFLDSPVEGIWYKTDSGLSGLTGPGGQFMFKKGDNVTFSIGAIELGQVDMAQTNNGSTLITPKVLAATTGTDNDTQTIIQSNLIRLLQTLDSDGDPNNGIYITETARVSAVEDTTIDFTQAEEEFATNAKLTTFLAEATGVAEADVVLVDRAKAWAHYEQTLTTVENLENNISVQNASFLFAIEDKSFSFAISAEIFQDASGAALTYSVAELPEWLAFDATSLTLSGTPINADVGNISFAVTATSTKGGSGSVNYVLTVNNINDAPEVSTPIADQAAKLDNALNFTFAEFTDVDVGDGLTYQATLADGSTLPSWLAFDAGTQTFIGTSSVADKYQIKVTATDVAGASVEDTFVLKVQDPRAPEQKLAIPQQEPLLEDQAFVFAIPAGTFVDPTGDAFVYSATLSGGAALPTWLSLSAEGQFAGTPGNADVGEIQLTVIVTDTADNQGFADFSLTVSNVNDAPTATAIAPQSVLLNDSLNLTFAAFTDVDAGDVLTYSATLTDGSPLPDWLNFDNNTRTFTSSTLTQAAQYPITVTAVDQSAASVATTFTLTVDTPPTLVPVNGLADQNASESQDFSFVIPEDAFHDSDTWDSLTYTALANAADLPSWLTFNSASRTFSGMPDNNDVGVLTIQVTATDQSGVSVADEGFLLTVANVNDAPTLQEVIADQKVNINTPLYVQLPASTFADVDSGDILSLSATLADGSALPAWMAFDANTRSFTGTPAETDNASLDIVVTATDTGGATASDTFNLTVGQANAKPQLAQALADQQAAEDQEFLFQFDANTFRDGDADTLQYSASLSGGADLPDWLFFDSDTRTFSGKPVNADVAKLAIKLTATDPDAASVSDLFFLDVANVNDAPTVINATSSQLAPQGSLFSLDAKDIFHDEDVGDKLLYKATLHDGTDLPSWLLFDSASLTFSGTPTEEDIGFLLAVKITATDTEQASVDNSFLVLVTPANTAPELANAIVDKTATEDALFLYEIPQTHERATSAFFDEDFNDPLRLSATLADGSDLPTWLTFDTDTRTFIGTPKNQDVSVDPLNPALNLKVTATDWVGATVQSNIFQINVANSNDAPLVTTPLPNRNVFPNEAFNLEIPAQTFTDEDPGDTLTFSTLQADGSPLPAWMHLDAETGLLSGTAPADVTLGTLNIKMTATDSDAAKVADIFSINVRLPNTPPTLTADKEIADQTAQEDLPYTLKLVKDMFQDVDKGDVLVWTAALSGDEKLDLPTWLIFDGATQTFSGVAKNADVGTLAITVTATDKDGASVSDAFDLNVANTNDAPVLVKAIANQKVVQNTAFTYEVDAATFTDEDPNAVLVLSATLANGDSLPPWLSFDSETRTFTSITNPTTLEAISINVTATDNGPEPLLSAATIFNLTVALPNTLPTTKGIADPKHATQGQMFVLRVPSDTFYDADIGDKLTLSATMTDGSSLPTWLTFDPGTRAFIGTPGNADVGTLAVTVTAADGDNARVSAAFALVVDNVNDAPILTEAIASKIAVNGQTFNMRLGTSLFTDPDAGDSLTLSAKMVDGSDLPTWLTFDTASGTFSGTPAADGSNQANLALKITATDMAGLQTSTIFNLQVLPPNAAPTVQDAIGSQTATEDQAFIFQVPGTTFADADGDFLQLTALQADGSSLPSWLTFDTDTGTFSGQPDNSDVGVLSVQVIATDPREQSSSTTFSLDVANSNDAPVLDLAHPIETQSASQGSRFNFRVPGDRFVDVDVADTLTYAATLSGGADLPTWLTFNPTTNVFGGTPTANDLGTLSIRLTATDSGGQSVSDTISIEVLPPNTAPTVATSQANQSVAEGAAFTYQVPVTTFADTDQGDTLQYAAASLTGDGTLPSWLNFDSATRTFFGKPENDAVGVLKVKVIATDSRGATASNMFDLSVSNTNDTPVLQKAIDDQIAPWDTAFNVQLAADTFIDPDQGDTLTLTASTLTNDGALPDWLKFDPETSTFSGTPETTDSTTTIKIIATDAAAGAKAFDIFTIKVAALNQTPTLDNPVADQGIQEDQQFSLQFASNTFSDPEAGSLTYSATGLAEDSTLPTWLTFDSDTRTLSGTPGNADVGTLGIKLIATDSGGASVANTFNISIANVNDAPTLLKPLSNQGVVKGTPLKYQFDADAFTDVDVGDTLTFTASNIIPGQNLPSWLQFDAATRTFSGTPGAGDVGVVNVKVVASDGQASVSDTFRLQVAKSQSGILLDSKVIGVNYSTPTHTGGLTDADGAFQFQPGETVTFSIGDIVIGQATGGSIITPWDFSKTGDVATVTNVLRLLQTLDADADPENGILIDEAARTNAANVSLNFNVSAETFATDQTLIGYLQDSVAKTTLVSTESAWRHFNGTLASVASNTEDNQGTLTSSAVSPVSVAVEDTAFSYKIPATTFVDVDSTTQLSFAVSRLDGSATLPEWLEFDTDTGLFSGTPHNADVGSLGFIVTATDALGVSSNELVDITILNSNDAPTLATDIVDQSVTRSTSLFFKIPENSFTDVDVMHGDSLSLAASRSDGTALPDWLNFDPGTGAFTGKPTSLETIIVKVTASDTAGAMASDLFNISVVDVNTAPTLNNAIVKQDVPKAIEDQPFRFQFAADTFLDLDPDDILSYSAQLPGKGRGRGSDAVKMLPDWLNFDADTRTFSGTPTQADVRTVNIKVIATDVAGKKVADGFRVRVEDSPDAPTQTTSIADKVATQGTPFSFTLEPETFNDTDPGDRLTLTASQADGTNLPTWLTFDDKAAAFSGTPQDAETLNIRLTATDKSDLSVAASFSLTVQALNHAPTLTAENLSVADINEDQPFFYQLPIGHFVDADNDVLTLTATPLSGGDELPSWLLFDAPTGSFSGTPVSGTAGTLGIKVTATDPSGAKVADTFNLTVNAVNHAPELKISLLDQTATLENLFNFQIDAGAFTDVDAGDSLTYTMSATFLGQATGSAEWLEFDQDTRAFNGSPSAADSGVINVTMTVTDKGGLAVFDTFAITVAAVNHAPQRSSSVASLLSQSAVEGEFFSFSLPNGIFTDEDAKDSISLSAANMLPGIDLPQWLNFNADTGTFSGTPGINDVGNLGIKVFATDAAGLKAADSFALTVQAVNKAPTLDTPIVDKITVVNSDFQFKLGNEVFSDANPGDILTVTAKLASGEDLPAWLIFDSGSRTFIGQPTETDTGVLAIVVTASDNAPIPLSVTDTFQLTVAHINHAPTLANPMVAQTANEDQPFLFQIPSTTFADEDVDAGRDTLTLTVKGLTANGELPAWLAFDSNNNTFSGTPTNDDVASFGIKVQATDSGNKKVFATFDVQVDNSNDVPVLANPVPNQLADRGNPFAFSLAKNTFTDVDAGDILTFSATLADATNLPNWLYFDSNSQTFSGTPTELGTLQVKVSVIDQAGASVASDFTIDITDPNHRPTLSNPLSRDDVQATEDQAFSFQFADNTFSDQDTENGDVLTYKAELLSGGELPTWLDFNAATRTFSGMPDNTQVGTIGIKLIAIDQQGAKAFDSFNLTVANVNDAPTVSNAIEAKTLNEGTPFNWQLPSDIFHDDDVGTILSYQATLSATSGEATAWLNFDPNTRTFSGTPGGDSVGIVNVRVTATDNDSNPLAVFTDFAIHVEAVNNAPTLNTAIGDQVATEDQVFNFLIPATTFVDTNAGDVLKFAAVNFDGTPLPSWLQFNETTGLFSGTPDNANVGSLSIKVTASDLADAKAFAVFNLSVVNSNDAPIIDQSLVDLTATEDQVFSFQIPAGTVSDADPGDELSYTASFVGNSSWLQFDENTLTFSGMPQNADVGSVPVTLTVTDKSGAEVAANFTISVVNVNDTPTLITPIADQQIIEDQAFNFSFADTFADVDAGDVITYTATLEDGSDLPDWLTFDAVNQNFSSMVTESLDDIVVLVTATDSAGTSIADSFAMTVVWNVSLLLDDSTNGLTGNDSDGLTNSGAISAQTKGILEYNLYGDGWSSLYVPPLGDGIHDGPYTVRVQQVDAAGNVLSVEPDITFTLDSMAPLMPNAILDDTTNGSFGYDTDSLTNSGVIFAPTNTEQNALLEYSLDDGTSWNTSYTAPTTDGVYTLLVRQTDAAGNVSAEQTIIFTLDSSVSVPNASLDDTSNGLSGFDTDGLTQSGLILAATNTEVGAVVEYSLDAGTWSTDYVEPASNGVHTVLVRQTDVAGNVSDEQTITFTRDTELPAIPDAMLDDTTNGLAGNNTDGKTNSGVITAPTNTEDGALLTYSQDNGTSWSTSYTAPTTDGMHMVLVRQTDAVGNISSEQAISFTLDTALPVTPDAVLDDTTNGLAGNDTDSVTRSGVILAPTNTEVGALVTYSQDDGTSWSTNYTIPTTDGDYTVLVRQTDEAGNVSGQQTLNFTLDTSLPATPNATVNDTTNGLSGNDTDGKTNTGTIVVPTNTETDAYLEYNLDDAGWSPSYTAPLTDGTQDGVHALLLRQTDAAGNVSTEQQISFSLDTVAPTLPNATLDDTTDGITGNETDGRTNTGAIVEPLNTETGALVEYSLDSGTTWTTSYTAATTDGEYTVLVRQTDAVGNVSSEQTINMTLDKTAPVLTVLSAVSDNVVTPTQAQANDMVTVSFTTDGSESGVPTGTIMDNAATVTLVSANSYTATYVATGSEASNLIVFELSATDAAGNVTTPVTTVSSSLPYSSPNVGVWLHTSYLTVAQDVDSATVMIQPGTDGNDSRIDTYGNDILDAGTDNDGIQGGAGDDILFWDGAELRGDADSGTDSIDLHMVDKALDLTILSSNSNTGMEDMTISQNASDVTQLNISDLLDVADGFDQLMVAGDAGDLVHDKDSIAWILNANNTTPVDTGNYITDAGSSAVIGADTPVFYNDIAGFKAILEDPYVTLDFIY